MAVTQPQINLYGQGTKIRVPQPGLSITDPLVSCNFIRIDLRDFAAALTAAAASNDLMRPFDAKINESFQAVNKMLTPIHKSFHTALTKCKHLTPSPPRIVAEWNIDE